MMCMYTSHMAKGVGVIEQMIVKVYPCFSLANVDVVPLPGPSW